MTAPIRSRELAGCCTDFDESLDVAIEEYARLRSLANTPWRILELIGERAPYFVSHEHVIGRLAARYREIHRSAAAEAPPAGR